MKFTQIEGVNSNTETSSVGEIQQQPQRKKNMKQTNENSIRTMYGKHLFTSLVNSNYVALTIFHGKQ